MTAAIALPIMTTTPAATALQGAVDPSAGEGFAAALAELLGTPTVTAQPQTATPAQTKGQKVTIAPSTDVQVDATAAVPLIAPTPITPVATQPSADQTVTAMPVAAQAVAAAALQLLQGPKVTTQVAATTEQTSPTTDAPQTPATTATQLPPSFAALVQAGAQQTAAPTSPAAKTQAKPASSKELPSNGKLEPTANASGTPATETKPSADTQLANAIQHALSGNTNNNAQNGSAKSDTGPTQLPATASPVAFALHMTTVDTTSAPAPTATAQAAVPLEALAVHIARKFDAGESRFEIRLDPAGLGKLDISLTIGEDGRVHAVLRAERVDTLDMLQRDARLLESQLRQSGLNVDSNSLNFSLGGGHGQRSAFADNLNSFAKALDIAPEAEPTQTTTARLNVRDGVDIRI